MTKLQVEKELDGKGDFVKIDYLTRFLEEELSFDMKKFIYLKLVRVYEKREMFNEAARIYSNLAEVSIAYSEKIRFHLKESENYVRAGIFDLAERAAKKALHNANAVQKPEISLEYKNIYKKLAEEYETQNKRRHAVKLYEKLVSMNLTEEEKFVIREKLLDLYEKLGMVREFNLLKGV